MCSKMSQLHAELTQQAYDLGFESIEEAEADGYHVAYAGNKVKLAFDASKAQEEAHKAWLKERDKVIKDLDHIALGYLEAGFKDHADALYRVIEFIKKGEV